MAEDYTYFDADTSVCGELTTSKLIVEGSVTGKIVAKEHVLIKNQGRVDARVITGKLMVEEGADYRGSFILK